MLGLLRCSWSVRLLEHATLHRRSVPVFGMVLFVMSASLGWLVTMSACTR